MEKYPHELDFISIIKRDGSGTEKVTQEILDHFKNNSIAQRDKFKLNTLSLSEGTYIASGFNSYVVRLKPAVPIKAFQEYADVNRIEVINHSKTGKGREYVGRNVFIDDFSLQDNGKTLKIFLK